MLEIDTILNTCYQGASPFRSIAAYSHILPIVLAMILGVFVFVKANFSLLSKVFLAFVTTFSLWLLGDVIIWTTNNYDLVYAIWATLDYIEIIFYILGLYFAIVFVSDKDVSPLGKLFLIAGAVAPFLITITNSSVLYFDHSWCESINNDSLTIYKIVLEALVLAVIVVFMVRSAKKEQLPEDKKADLIVLSSIFLFLAIFGGTEYLASVTGVYETHLYSLFILPFFLMAITYAIFELDIFQFDIVGTHYLVIGFVVLMAGQLFFVEGTADILLTALTMVISIGLSILLFRNLRKESDQRKRIEKLSFELEGANEKLKTVDKLKTEFLSLASHQLRSPLTAIKGYTSMLLDGDFGSIAQKQKDAVQRVFDSSKHLTRVVEDLLNVSKIEQGGMQYVMQPFDLEKPTKDLVTDLSITAKQKGLELSFQTDKSSPYMINGDMEKLRQVILNLIDNSIKYTKVGSITVKLSKEDGKIRLSIKDTGVGLTPEIRDTLFQKFSRGEGMIMNTTGSGLGLYLAKNIVKSHNGKIWVESEGKEKGSTFILEMDQV